MRTLSLALAVILIAGCSSTPDTSPQMTTDGMPDEMKAWIESGVPGEQHELLKTLVGNWTVTQKHRMAPGEEPATITASARKTMIMEGRFLQEDFAGNVMGAPFHGRSTFGYDRPAKMYNISWIDSMSTGIMRSTGHADAAGVITLTGKFIDPMGQSKPFRSVFRIVSPDQHTLEWYEHDKNGVEFMSMEMTYDRE